jgi:hypothetical protein
MQTGAEQSATYNTLLAIANAHRALNERGGEEVVGRLLSIVADAGLESTIGIRLLHKHNDISENEMMLETSAVDEEGFALTTGVVQRDELPGVVCNSWQFTNGKYIPVEFSNVNIVRSEFEMSDYDDVFDKLANAIVETNVSDILGPCLNYSDYVAQHAPSEKAAFLEKTDYENRANVVRYVLRSDPEFNNSAKTKWHAKKITDSSGKTIWMTACSCACSVAPEGGHLGTKTHRYNP